MRGNKGPGEREKRKVIWMFCFALFSVLGGLADNSLPRLTWSGRPVGYTAGHRREPKGGNVFFVLILTPDPLRLMRADHRGGAAGLGCSTLIRSLHRPENSTVTAYLYILPRDSNALPAASTTGVYVLIIFIFYFAVTAERPYGYSTYR